MKKSIPVNKKSRGRPKKQGGVDPVSAVRLPANLTKQVDAWSEDHGASRSEAIRRLVELGLTVRTKAKQPSAARAHRAKELATKAIEKIIDRSMPPEERAHRQRRLVRGPEEFRETRVDRPKAKK
jgi:Arc/MetJ-type ribon-helix-helix transcriptional regulator